MSEARHCRKVGNMAIAKHANAATALRLLLVALSTMLGIWFFYPRLAPQQNIGDRPRNRAPTQTVIDEPDRVQRIIEHHARTLGIAAVTRTKSVGNPQGDPLSTVRFAGVVESAGAQLAVLVVDVEGSTHVLALKTGDEVVASWRVLHIEPTSVTLVREGRTHVMNLFD